MTPGALAAAERLQPQSLTRTLASLERQHLAVRQPDDRDRRRSLLAITDAGRHALLTDMRQRDAWLAAVMAHQLTSAEQQLLRIAGDLMDRIADAQPPHIVDNSLPRCALSAASNERDVAVTHERGGQCALDDSR
jgi:hypothetical protein